MSSKAQKSEQAVLSRRLKPIYDAIDSGQAKKALHEADKVLKKHPNMAVAKILKALALIRLEKADEARPIIAAVEEALHDGNADENMIDSLCHCYKELFEPEKIVALYEFLTDRYKGNSGFLNNLFIAYVRVCDFKGQQKVALNMYKEFNHLPHYLWAVISTYMQGLSDKKLGDTMYFPLAEKMLSKVVYDPQFEMNGGLYLNALILQARKKFVEAAEFLESRTLSQDSIPGTTLKQHLDDLYKDGEKHDVVIGRAMLALEKDPSDWASWTNIIDCTMHLLGKASNNEEKERMINRLVDVYGLTLNTAEITNDTTAKRGPYLARLLIIDQLLKNRYLTKSDLESHALGSPMSGFISLVDTFYNKPYCFHDLSTYLNLLDDVESQTKFLSHIEQLTRAPNLETRSDFDQGQMCSTWANILYEQCAWCFELLNSKTGEPIPLAKLQISLERNFLKLREAIAKDAPSSIIILHVNLMVHFLWEMFVQNGNWRIIYVMICLLETFLEKYPPFAPLPLLLSRLYPIFGNTQRVFDLCNLIRIRYIQKDSLGFFQFFLPERFGRFKTAVLQYTNMGSMYDHNEHEVSDCLVHAYKNYSFQKIPKIVEFLNRCTKSVFATGADVMNRWLSACFSLDSLGTVASTLAGDKITDKEWDEIIDNRDFSIMPVTMLPNVLERVQNESFQEIKAFLKLKHLLCRSIGLIGSTLNSGDFLSTTKAIFSHLDHCKEKFSVENDLGKNLISFSNISVHELISCGQLELPLFFVRLAQHLRAEINGKERESENENNNVDGKTADSFDFDKHLPSISELESALKGFKTEDIEILQQKSSEIFSVGKILEQSASQLQLLVISLFACKFIERLVMEHFGKEQQPDTKSKRDKKQTQTDFVADRFSVFQSLILCHIRKINSVLSSLEPKYSPMKAESFTESETYLVNLLTECNSSEHRILVSLENSHQESLEEMKSAIAHLDAVLELEPRLEKLAIQQKPPL